MPYVETCSAYRLRTRPFATEAELDAWLDSKRERPNIPPEELDSNPIIARMQARRIREARYWCPGCAECARVEVSEQELEAHDWYYKARLNSGQLHRG